jgi:hypothetical protein
MFDRQEILESRGIFENISGLPSTAHFVMVLTSAVRGRQFWIGPQENRSSTRIANRPATTPRDRLAAARRSPLFLVGWAACPLFPKLTGQFNRSPCLSRWIDLEYTLSSLSWPRSYRSLSIIGSPTSLLSSNSCPRLSLPPSLSIQYHALAI